MKFSLNTAQDACLNPIFRIETVTGNQADQLSIGGIPMKLSKRTIWEIVEISFAVVILATYFVYVVT
jgi:hypothetical protein